MSHRFFKVGEFVVRTGWDPSLQVFYLQVFDFRRRIGEETVYDSHEDPNRHDQQVDWILGKAAELFGISALPATLPADLQRDRARNATDLRHNYDKEA